MDNWAEDPASVLLVWGGVRSEGICLIDRVGAKTRSHRSQIADGRGRISVLVVVSLATIGERSWTTMRRSWCSSRSLVSWLVTVSSRMVMT